MMVTAGASISERIRQTASRLAVIAGLVCVNGGCSWFELIGPGQFLAFGWGYVFVDGSGADHVLFVDGDAG